MKTVTNRGGIRKPLRVFNEYAARPPSRWQRVAAVVLAVALPLALWDKRGPAVGIVALVVYGSVFLIAAFNHRRMRAWSRRHVALDSLLIVPLIFLMLALVTNLSLALCVAIAAAAGAVLVPFMVWRRLGTLSADRDVAG